MNDASLWAIAWFSFAGLIILSDLLIWAYFKIRRLFKFFEALPLLRMWDY